MDTITPIIIVHEDDYKETTLRAQRVNSNRDNSTDEQLGSTYPPPLYSLDDIVDTTSGEPDTNRELEEHVERMMKNLPVKKMPRPKSENAIASRTHAPKVPADPESDGENGARQLVTRKIRLTPESGSEFEIHHTGALSTMSGEYVYPWMTIGKAASQPSVLDNIIVDGPTTNTSHKGSGEWFLFHITVVHVIWCMPCES